MSAQPSRAASAGQVAMQLSGRGGGEKSSLPKLQPHLNKRAQLIIASHMNSDAGAFLPGSSKTPVLAQLESTAPQTARTHDISHLGDKAHTLTPTVPPSLIDEKDFVYEASFFPNSSGSSIYSERDGMWYTKVFPSDRPSNRQDAVYLDTWITKALARHQRELDEQQNTREDIAQTVQGLVPILSIALHEIVRQVTHHCAERGRALEKLWKAYVELFHRVLKQMQKAQAQQRKRTKELHKHLASVTEELTSLRRTHPENIHSVISELEDHFSSRQHECEEDLERKEAENARLKSDMRTHVKELEVWYPGFLFYQDSYIKNHIPTVQRESLMQRLRGEEKAKAAAAQGDGAHPPPSGDSSSKESGSREAVPFEVAIAEDFKRLLAVLAPEKRKAIGQDLSFITEAAAPPVPAKARAPSKSRAPSKGGRKARDSVDSTDEGSIDRLKAEVKQQEERIRELRDSIANLEAVELEAASVAEAASAVGPSRVMARSSVLEDPNMDLAGQLAKDIGVHTASLARQQLKKDWGVVPAAPKTPPPLDDDDDGSDDGLVAAAMSAMRGA